jgi:hypothetical protein
MNVRLEPVVEVQPKLLVGTARHRVAVLIEPRLGLAQPAPGRLYCRRLSRRNA